MRTSEVLFVVLLIRPSLVLCDTFGLVACWPFRKRHALRLWAEKFLPKPTQHPGTKSENLEIVLRCSHDFLHDGLVFKEATVKYWPDKRWAAF